MAGTRREVYEAGRADERSEVVAWLRDAAAVQVGAPSYADAFVHAAAAIERGEHAEVEVPGDVGRD
jgi:hypothetical protein